MLLHSLLMLLLVDRSAGTYLVMAILILLLLLLMLLLLLLIPLMLCIVQAELLIELHIGLETISFIWAILH